MQKGLRRTPAVAVAALFVVLALAACGGGGDSGGVASVDGSSQSETDGTATTGEQDPQEAALEFARCMREHGIDVLDPSADGGIGITVDEGTDRKKLEEAQEACQPILENAAPQLSEEQRSVMQDAQLAFAKCMREHGIDMPDPQFGEGGIVTQQASGRGGAPDPDDPKFQDAQKACQPIMEEAAREAGLPAPEQRTESRSEDGS